MITFYDAATSAFALAAILLFAMSVYLLFKVDIKPVVSLIWLIVVFAFPIVGPIALFIYLTQRQKRSRGD